MTCILLTGRKGERHRSASGSLHRASKLIVQQCSNGGGQRKKRYIEVHLYVLVKGGGEGAVLNLLEFSEGGVNRQSLIIASWICLYGAKGS